jgi:hypothetical protein
MIGPFLGDYSCLVVGSLTTLPLLLRDEAILRCSWTPKEYSSNHIAFRCFLPTTSNSIAN